jgi:uncharacterized membrane protein
MYQRPKIKSFLKSCLAIALVIALVFGNAHSALAARTGGRMGGGSFRAPTRTYAPPSRGYRGGGYGGGFGFPFIFPFFGFGGGGLFTLLIVFAVANFLIRSFNNAGEEAIEEYNSNPTVSVAQLQIGLLASARSLQTELNQIAESADTGSASGRAQVVQEVSLALLRHPEYWVYGAARTEQTRLNSAEAKFNQLSLAERSKVERETLSNVNNQLQQGENKAALPGDDSNGETADPGEYIVVTILVGTEGKLQLPAINGSEDLRQVLSQFGGLASDRLLAIEVLWAPQADEDTLTTDDILAQYPNLQLV